MCKEVEAYRRNWRNLELATENLKKQLFGLQCKLEGVEAEINAKLHPWEECGRVKQLKEAEKAVSNIKIQVTEENLYIAIPNILGERRGKSLIVENFDVREVIYVISELKVMLTFIECRILPVSEKSLLADLNAAIFGFESAFQTYMI